MSGRGELFGNIPSRRSRLPKVPQSFRADLDRLVEWLDAHSKGEAPLSVTPAQAEKIRGFLTVPGRAAPDPLVYRNHPVKVVET